MSGPYSPSSGADEAGGFTPQEIDRSTALSELIRSGIDAAPDSMISFARFMELALYEPNLGYYRQAPDRPTRRGDFLTAPETHPVFGRTLARWVEEMWAELDHPDPFCLIEFGAGSGTLALSIIEGLRRHGSGLAEAIRYEPVETNEHARADISHRFDEAGLADRLITPDRAAAPRTGVVIANEFLDALPVHRVVMRRGELKELFVGWREGPVLLSARPSTPELAERLAADAVTLAEGQVAEICLELEPWLAELAGRLHRGYVIVIDYGSPAVELYGPRHLAGTLLGYRAHRVAPDPLANIGLTDLTAHVDFTAVEWLASAAGFEPVRFETQSQFLVGAGLEQELQAIQASPQTTLDEYLRARSAIVRLLDPRHMGRFGVLTLGRNLEHR